MMEGGNKVYLLDYLANFFPPNTLLIPDEMKMSFPTKADGHVMEECDLVTTGR